MVKRLRRCPLKAESGVRVSVGLPKKQPKGCFFMSNSQELDYHTTVRELSYERMRVLYFIPYANLNDNSLSLELNRQRSSYFISICLFLVMTSCAPPSTILVAETNVITAFFCNSGIVSAPQLHIVDFILATVVFTLSLSLPA